ncbi:tumor protein p53 inducible protein 3, putative [Ichthyophthirius multifiliis]|uniref:Tumor protein p53 inducible protein 3, putative n=1 Tax=Ichthyophthirius multifiliis TaxID=5932 RepID=G0QW69_ICHMU|nr:tumor protein p53 inducible protein 3, putative [Ichthyophthirius multifiliis]EGR30536.1 tumor protein p53 inducible protein 3, putative [Ichthyophthirius multifiliis]|eukprot:XP_004032123.1 tumor protein p53 inducible protein 3, putative [Ichthyophthirius multifiliis]
MFLKLKYTFSLMKHIHLNGFGGVDILQIKQSPIPVCSEKEVLIKIQSTALNRADILQRQGKYSPPKSASQILGLEAAGYLLDENGKEKKKVMALLSGGGYAQYTKVHQDHIIEIPENLNFSEAASITECWLTAFMLLRFIGKLQKNENVLIYAGASGVGTAAIQLCKHYEANAIITTSSKEKVDFCLKLGAKAGINYKQEDIQNQKQKILEQTNGKGIDIILDCIGAQNSELTTNILNMDARWILYGLMGGAKVKDFSFVPLVQKRASLITSTLRNRDDEYKKQLVQQFCKEVLKEFSNKQFTTIIDKQYDVTWDEKGLQNIKDAHLRMEQNINIGKIVLNFK